MDMRAIMCLILVLTDKRKESRQVKQILTEGKKKYWSEAGGGNAVCSKDALSWLYTLTLQEHRLRRSSDKILDLHSTQTSWEWNIFEEQIVEETIHMNVWW